MYKYNSEKEVKNVTKSVHYNRVVRLINVPKKQCFFKFVNYYTIIRKSVHNVVMRRIWITIIEIIDENRLKNS